MTFQTRSKSVFGKSETNVESEEYAREKTRKMRKVKQEGELKFLFSRFFASFRGQIPNFQTGSQAKGKF